MNAYEMSKLLDVSARPEVIGLNDVRGAFVLTASPAIQLELALHCMIWPALPPKQGVGEGVHIGVVLYGQQPQ